MIRRLLLLSSARDGNGIFLLHASSAIRALLGASVRRVLLIPYAGVTITPERYAERAAVPFAKLGYELRSIVDASDPVRAVEDAEAIVVGGGNTFHLLASLYDRDLLEVIRARVGAGVPYIGWSAGAVITAPTMGTTNDMPIIEPKSLRALNLIPFQINAHYTDFHPPGHQGETRAERLEEYVAVNRTMRVIGLREGCLLRITNDEIALHGLGSAPVFSYGAPLIEYHAGDDISFLLRG
jgi:dipeptidase E